MKDLPDEILVVDEDSIDNESKILVVVTLKKNGDQEMCIRDRFNENSPRVSP